MKILFRSILCAGRRRRCKVVGIALWILRSVRDVESAEVYRYSDVLDRLDSHPKSVSKREYAAIEEEYSNCEHALDVLDCAIEDIDIAYCFERF